MSIRVKEVKDLVFHISNDEQRAIVENFPKYEVKLTNIRNIPVSFHTSCEQEDLLVVSDILCGAIQMMSKSIDKECIIERVHFITAENEIVVYMEFKQDEVSKIVLPRFLGSKYSNIDALRRISTNLSGQYNIRVRLYI